MTTCKLEKSGPRGELVRLVGLRRARRAAARGVTLVEVLIVVAIMAIIAGSATLLVFPQLEKSRVDTAALSAGEVKKAADLYQNLNATGDACPTIQDLTASKTLDPQKLDDPWGTPFKIGCEDGEVVVRSLGKDRKENTPDDVLAGMTKSQLEKIKNL